jgi:hypothetical protein
MKSKLQKEMRKIRIQLKVHDITEEKKIILRKELERLREIQIQSLHP